MTQVIRLLLVDDHALLRGALAERLDREPGLTVVAQAASADEAIHKADALAPDVILMDIDMPGKLCFEAAQAMRATHPRVRIIILSAYMHDWYVERALEIGASGYLTKGESAETVIAAVQAAANGEQFFSETVEARITDLEAEGRDRRTRARTLTPREMEVLRYVAKGMTKKEIAALMHLSVKTVDRHCGNLMKKLDIHDRVDLTRYAIREGMCEA